MPTWPTIADIFYIKNASSSEKYTYWILEANFLERENQKQHLSFTLVFMLAWKELSLESAIDLGKKSSSEDLSISSSYDSILIWFLSNLHKTDSHIS